ncbi:reverse transcriptase domain-containing protein [Tanacetum coccineum]
MINMKRNPKKCTFGAEKKLFLGHVVNMKGIKACPEKAEVVIRLQSPRTLKEILPGAHDSGHHRPERSGPENARRMAKWTFKLGAVDINYRPQTSIRGQILADFIAERPDEDGPPTRLPIEEEISKPWTLFTDGSSWLEGSGAEIILTNPEGMKFTYALRFEFDTSNNEAEYEALVAGLSKKQSMIKYLEKAKTLINNFKKFSIEQVSRSENKKADTLSKIASTSFAHLTKQVLVEVLKKSIEEKEILVVVEGGYSWMTSLLEYLTNDMLPAETKKARAIKIKSKQYAVIGGVLYPPQTNGLVERVNHSLGEWIKTRLDEGSKNWIEEVSHVLWAHRTMIKTSNGNTPFSLTYGTEAVISIEIGIPSLRCTEVDQILNDEALLLNLDMLEEKRERAAIREAKSKAKWKSTTTPRSVTLLSSQETSCTKAMRPAKERKAESLFQNEKDRMKWWKHLEKEHTRSGMEAETYSREPGMSKT